MEEMQRSEENVPAEETKGEGIIHFIWIWLHLKENMGGRYYLFFRCISFDSTLKLSIHDY